MADINQNTTHELWVEGRQLTLTLVNNAPATTLTLTWTIPTTAVITTGVVVLLSEAPFNAENFPVDGTKYTPSLTWGDAGADRIGNAQVVAAYYGYFNEAQVLTATVTGIDPTKIYYASIHAASNVLQYYPVGIQSYPLETSRVERLSPSYAGSIPSTTVPPQDPVDGQAYFDPVSNRVFVWNATMAAWLEAVGSTVVTGARPPVDQLNFFFNYTGTPSVNVFFDGAWVAGTPANLRVKIAGVGNYAAFANAVVNPNADYVPTTGDIGYFTIQAPMSGPETYQVKVYTMGQWLLLTGNLVQYDTTGAGGWEDVKIGDPVGGNALPNEPVIGNFFYSTASNDLFVWTGTAWVKADTAGEGSPTTDKVGIGTDGSYDERLRLMKILKGQMGWPQVCVELSEDQFNIAIDNALDEFRRRADNAYSHRYVIFTLKEGQQVYYLNDPRLKTDKIVNVINIHRISMLGVSALSTESNVYAQAFFHQYYTGSMVDVLSIHLSHQLSEVFEKIFAGNLTFTWDEASRQLQIHRRMRFGEEKVLLECVMERTENELMLDRWAKQWIQGWAHAELKEMLGMIRSKYSSGLPGPTGGLSLNGDLLLSEARQDFEELLRQITDYEVGNGGVNFMNTAFMIG